MKYLQLFFLCFMGASFQSQAEDLSGVWVTDNYQCPVGVVHSEKVKIEKNGMVYTAIKLVGDNCVPAGFVSFIWDSATNNCHIFVGSPSNPANVVELCSINVENDNNFIVSREPNLQENKINFRKESNKSSSITEVLPNLDIHIPSANYQKLDGTTNIWADLEYNGVDSKGSLIWKLKDYGINE